MPVLGAVLCTLATAWFAWREVRAGVQPSESLTSATPGTRLAGVLLAENPQPYVYLASPSDAPPQGATGLLPGSRAFFSRDWKRLALSRPVAGNAEQITLPSGKEVSLTGPFWLQPEQDGSVLAVLTAGDTDGPAILERIQSDGTRQRLAEVDDPYWIETAGGRLALGMFEGTRILRADGSVELELPGESSLGALSTHWMAVERELEGRTELVLCALSEGSEHSFAVEAGTTLLLAEEFRLALHVAPEALCLVSLEGEPHEVARHAPPAGSTWRAAAVGPRGELAVSWLTVLEPLRVVETEAGRPVAGRAKMGVVRFASGEWRQAPRPLGRQWESPSWGPSSPELAFDDSGRLFAQDRVRAIEVRP